MDGRYRLKKLATAADWQAYHKIRRRVLFEARGRVGVYQEDHPDEHAEDNHPLLFTLDGEPVGTVRVDCLPDASAVIRMVAVAERHQRQGHGRTLLQLAEGFARALGARRTVVNAAPDATEFYARSGYSRHSWSDPDGGRRDVIQMTKDL
jgi:GNAT superfamily N-acetyltransferase